MKTFYFVVKPTTLGRGDWGRGITLKDALKFCGVNKLTEKFVIHQAIIKGDATDEQVENLCKCFNVNDLGGVNLYSNPSKEDIDMITDYLLGWITNEDFL